MASSRTNLYVGASAAEQLERRAAFITRHAGARPASALGVDDIDGAATQHRCAVLCDGVHEPLPCLAPLPADVRRQDHVWERVEGRGGRRRLRLLHVERRAADGAALQRIDQRLLAHDAAARRVDQHAV
eukprot:468500-Pleurochrysis_carterae.AAC.4